MATKLRYGSVFQDAELASRNHVVFWGPGGFLQGASFISTVEGRPMTATSNEGLVIEGFFVVASRYVAFNATLEGGKFNKGSPNTVQPMRFVHDQEYGWAVGYKQISVSYTVTNRSSEIDETNATDAKGHVYATIAVVWKTTYKAE
jgi:hypothetical protein